MIATLTSKEVEMVSGGHDVWTTIRWYNPLTGQWSEYHVLVNHHHWPEVDWT